jgi:hypothetical protein
VHLRSHFDGDHVSFLFGFIAARRRFYLRCIASMKPRRASLMPRFGSAALDRCTAEPQEHGEGNVRPRPSRSSVKCGAVHDACPANRITHRTAEYGSVHAVVWEGRRREAPPIPISQTQSDRLLGRPSLRTFHRKMSARVLTPATPRIGRSNPPPSGRIAPRFYERGW